MLNFKYNALMQDCRYIEIGKFRIYEKGHNSVWIEIIGDGEGGEFSTGELERRIQALYEEEF